jgi:hypothetical protein
VNLITQTAIPTAIWTFYNTLGATNNYSYGLYVNDKWSLNNHWNFQLGLRYDKYKADNENGQESAGASGLSPRLGASFDLFGDSKHIFKASYARYNSKVLETITGAVSGVGNPKEIDYAALSNPLEIPGTGPRLTFAQLQNPALYGIGLPGYSSYYNDPTLNVKLASDLKAPTVDEIQVSYAYSFDFASIGNGYLKVSSTYKNWKNLIDVTSGNSGTVTDPVGDVLYMNVWENNPNAKRTYRDLVLEGQFNTNGWTLGGNVTWSSLKGNYEGESAASPGRGESIDAWSVQNGVTMFDKNVIHPYGYLSGQDPLRMRLTAAKAFENAWGKTTVGWIYRFDAGQHYSNDRVITRGQLGGYIDPTNHLLGTNISSQFGSTGTQYLNNTWNDGVYPGQAYLDLSLTQDFPLFKVANKTVWAFGKLVVQNVLNHQQATSYNTTYGPATGSYPNAVNSPWIQGPLFGQSGSASNYLGQGTIPAPNARTIVASAGIRF